MSTYFPKPITSAQVAATATTYYTAPTNIRAAKIIQLIATNTTATNRTITVNLVPSAGSAAASNTVIQARIVPAYDSVILYETIGQMLAGGGTLQATADSATAVTLSGSVIEINA
jgi:hypothetical protein